MQLREEEAEATCVTPGASIELSLALLLLVHCAPRDLIFAVELRLFIRLLLCLRGGGLESTDTAARNPALRSCCTVAADVGDNAIADSPVSDGRRSVVVFIAGALICSRALLFEFNRPCPVHI